ncbi:MAG TPA: N-acetyltransferase [Blastocatellia bacterium]|nr:N-acetyltransferase [Blastocatellia bacterium]HMV84145.1 N-acetyltransferase [Blastocatellia bacterium]HMX25280.1 N-acetyltransferase [Blastocatellia bacterium]HMY71308.1 N-acetyltransferase [Blastocatellia bacterium]HMZ19873.1 N-acetyltransferase [Blastocatellia bacterium]
MIVVRREKPEDIALIHQINAQAFGREAEANLVDALRRNGKVTLSLVAEDNGRVIGHILFSPVTIDPQMIEMPEGSMDGIGLAPMAVAPERQNEGIGSRLVAEGLRQCREAGHRFMVVLGHANYYPRFGFAPASRYNVKSEYDVRDEVFMIRELQQGSLLGIAGTAKYQSEFNEI